jgi:homoserine dehydrogenase
LPVPLAILGLGGVGRALLRQVLETRDGLARRTGLLLRPVALADSLVALSDPAGLADALLEAALRAKDAGGGLDHLPGSSARDGLSIPPRTVVLDLTASTDTAPLLQAALANGGAVVLANKLGLTRPYAESQFLYESRRVRYEATVGAGLPVIATLATLLDTGDRLVEAQGVLSGTLAYLASQLEENVPYSAAVARARALGYTEPDPREDLSGRDVARKALIMARTAGWPLEMADLQVEALYPPTLSELSIADFLDRASALDGDYAARIAAARERGEVLRYVARVTPSGGSVGLLSVPRTSGLAALRGTSNHIAFTTDRYRDEPLVLSGPGAGVEVTAAGVLGDVIALVLGGWLEED